MFYSIPVTAFMSYMLVILTHSERPISRDLKKYFKKFILIFHLLVDVGDLQGNEKKLISILLAENLRAFFTWFKSMYLDVHNLIFHSFKLWCQIFRYCGSFAAYSSAKNTVQSLAKDSITT